MKYFFFDTETTGVPKDYKASAEDVNNWPRITQLSFVTFDENENVVMKFNNLIKPEGWTIPTVQELTEQKNKDPHFFERNGMSTERCEAEGVEIEKALTAFIAARLQAKYSIAHNISFDSKIIRAEMFRQGRTEEFTSEKICTMMKSTSYCQLCVQNSNRFKWPKLTELHQHLFGCDFDGAHDALSDVMATAKCFFELKRRGVIVLDQPKKEKSSYTLL